MIIGIGTDIVRSSRILKIEQKFGDKFRRKVLNEIEHTRYHELTESKKQQYLTSCFAVKEAAAKSLGTGFRNGITFKDIILYHNVLGCPKVKFLNKASSVFRELGAFQVDISLSHDRGLTIAFVVISS